MEFLPRFVIEDEAQEVELITRTLHSIFAPLFEDLDAGFLFRWYCESNAPKFDKGLLFTIQFGLHRIHGASSDDNDEVMTARPAASLIVLHGAALGARVGCGEVKPHYQAPNHALIARDLIRVGQTAKDALDRNKARLAFGFTVVG